ncbi:hypothetical protein [Mycobacterium sp.]|uniref:hypothetical protein n=1 Tax=Mycobacterium sp. TaxID=1785 RepID=UPI0025CD7208|nr:hypothetical protein [Mycobacterium sp.]MBW0015712.1 DUF3291 domain-containing protein [Mycobacterium sp.]
MPTIPWTTPKLLANPPASSDVVVMASRFELRSFRDVPQFLLAAMRIRRQMLNSPGVLGLSLIAKPLHKSFFTLSAWQDREALDASVPRQPHAPTMVHFHPKMAGSRFVFWTVPRSELPIKWPDALRRLDSTE